MADITQFAHAVMYATSHAVWIMEMILEDASAWMEIVAILVLAGVVSKITAISEDIAKNIMRQLLMRTQTKKQPIWKPIKKELWYNSLRMKTNSRFKMRLKKLTAPCKRFLSFILSWNSWHMLVLMKTMKPTWKSRKRRFRMTRKCHVKWKMKNFRWFKEV